jgi:hypothetical protein
MNDCRGIGRTFGGRSMPGPFSTDLRVRVIEAVKEGASRRGRRTLRDQPELGNQMAEASESHGK